MNTTNFYIELLVIGTHSLIGFSLFVLSYIDPKKIDFPKLLSINSALIILAIAYIIGIIVDRLSDRLLVKKDKRIKEKYKVEGLPRMLTRRFYILIRSKDVYDQLEYARIRLRIARASTINFVITTLGASSMSCVD